MRRLPTAIALLLAIAPLPAVAEEEWVGRYQLAEGPDVVGELQLDQDGSFRFGMSAGALDTMARGRWVSVGDGITLRTEPRPAPPVFALTRAQPGKADGTLSILVTWPNGNGIAGIDFRIIRESGEPIDDYTQVYGWRSEPGASHRIVSIQLSEPIHGLVSPVFDVPADAREFTFVLTPNDLGRADFDNAPVERSADGLRLHWRGGVLRFVRRN
jgi:hypothetical protein